MWKRMLRWNFLKFIDRTCGQERKDRWEAQYHCPPRTVAIWREEIQECKIIGNRSDNPDLLMGEEM